MVEVSTVARPYAQAAFSVAKTGNMDQWTDWLASWSAVASHADIKSLVNNPKLSHQEVLDVFVSLSKTQAQAQAIQFLQALVENGRLLALPEIASQFAALRNQLEGAARAVITSAFPMNEEDVQKISSALEKKFGCKLKITVEVDASLIGGVCVAVGDQILDSSVRGKLDRMKIALTA